jgi:hypothetical protein
MADKGYGAALAVTVDLELDLDQQARTDGHRLEAVAGRLVELCDEYRIPATWGVADPALSAATDSIVTRHLPHEIAVLGDPAWVGIGAGRTRFARELSRRVEGARTSGLPVSTLMLRNVELTENFDLLAKHQISAVRSAVGRRGPTRIVQPQTLRFGVLLVTPSIELPGRSRWFPGGGGRFSACRAIRQSIGGASVAQLVIDGPRLAEVGEAGLKVVQGVLRFAAEQRERGALSIDTLGSLAAKLTQPREASPARSILRSAA